MKALYTAKRTSDLCETIIQVSLVISMGAIAVVVNLAVFFRYVLSAPLSWTTELSNYLLIYTVLFGSCVALRHKKFVKIEALINLIPFPADKIIIVLSQSFIIGFIAVCIIAPTAMIQKAALTQTISPALNIPMVYLYRLLQFGFATMLFFAVMNLIEQITTFRLKPNGDVKTQ